jgi:hypothetical protein
MHTCMHTCIHAATLARCHVLCPRTLFRRVHLHGMYDKYMSTFTTKACRCETVCVARMPTTYTGLHEQRVPMNQSQAGNLFFLELHLQQTNFSTYRSWPDQVNIAWANRQPSRLLCSCGTHIAIQPNHATRSSRKDSHAHALPRESTHNFRTLYSHAVTKL